MLLQIDSKQEVKWATVLFTPDIDDILYCSACYISFLQAFHADYNHVIFEMIPGPQLEGSQS